MIVYVSYVFSRPFLFVCHILAYYYYYHYYYYYIDVCLYSNEREKERLWIWMNGKVGRTLVELGEGKL